MNTQTSLKKSNNENIVPFTPLNMFEEMEQMFENLMHRNWLHPRQKEKPFYAENFLKVDVIDQDNNIMVKAAVPGVKKDKITLSATNHSVTIRGTTHEEHKEEKGEYYRREISSGSFLRTVPLPAAIDEKSIKAKFKNGMLEIMLPKLESEKRHHIEIE